MKILLTNDDGVFAPGILALRERLREVGDVTVVAPASEQSAAGHSITIAHPLMVRKIEQDGELLGFAVEGKPADCVKLGICELFGGRPDLVVSGINNGANAGINVLYSGTVAAAIEGAFFGVPSIAVSLAEPKEEAFPEAARWAIPVIERILATNPVGAELFNVNLPAVALGPPKGIRLTQQGLVCYREEYDRRQDPWGRHYYWLQPNPLDPVRDLDTDLGALAAGFVSVTPLHFDLTERRRLASLSEHRWDLAEPERSHP